MVRGWCCQLNGGAADENSRAAELTGEGSKTAKAADLIERKASRTAAHKVKRGNR